MKNALLMSEFDSTNSSLTWLRKQRRVNMQEHCTRSLSGRCLTPRSTL